MRVIEDWNRLRAQQQCLSAITGDTARALWRPPEMRYEMIDKMNAPLSSDIIRTLCGSTTIISQVTSKNTI